MFSDIDLTKRIKNKDYKEYMNKAGEKLGVLQHELRKDNMAVIIVIEGWGASGKGALINELISLLDPRGFTVYNVKEANDEENRYPFLWRFWTKTPEKGRIAIFDRSWYRRVLNERIDKKINISHLQYDYNEIISFEKQLTQDNLVIIKLFLHISEKEQKQRLKELSADPSTAWRVTEEDLRHHKQYNEYLDASEDMIVNTNSEFAPWTIVEANDTKFATYKMYKTVIRSIENALILGREKANDDEIFSIPNSDIPDYLSEVDLSLTLPKDEYQKKSKECQEKLTKLHNEIYFNKIPVIIVFEGWDASGKGGTIKRLTKSFDPRGYRVVSTPAPTPIEKAHYYLWRFWNEIPKSGHIAIFDRSWYGRVLVERVEEICTINEWQRGYNEINEMEKHLINSGAIVIKFWMQIDKDEQKKRFIDREQNPIKAWKLTAEDWRNREKWEEYHQAINEMIFRTSTQGAHWNIISANSKHYARIAVMEKVIEAVEMHLK